MRGLPPSALARHPPHNRSAFTAPGQVLSAKAIKAACREKLAAEFTFMREQAGGDLATFMDFVQCVRCRPELTAQSCARLLAPLRRFEYQIETVIDILKATQEGTDPSSERLQEALDTCHPLGRFASSVMKAIAAFDSSPEGASPLAGKPCGLAVFPTAHPLHLHPTPTRRP